MDSNVSRLNKRNSLVKNNYLGYLPEKTHDIINELILKGFELNEILFSVLKEHNNRFSKKLCEILNAKKHDKKIDEYDLNELSRNDFIGYFIMSNASLGEKNSKGMIFTPSHQIMKMFEYREQRRSTPYWFVSRIFAPKEERSYYDPSAGTGNFLIEAAQKGKEVSGVELDSTNCLAANSTISYITGVEKEHVKNLSFFDSKANPVEYCIGNPPWGIKGFKSITTVYGGKDIVRESFEAFIIKIIESKQSFSFILPSSIMHRQTYRRLRLKLHELGSININTGVKFKDVNVDAIELEFIYGESGYKINGRDFFKYFSNEKINPKQIWCDYSKYDMKRISKLFKQEYTRVKDVIETSFMGIVTGNNKKYIYNEHKENYLPIITGKNIHDGVICNELKYINPDEMEHYQQVNKDSKFSENKIVYRFIGKYIKCAYDEEGLATTNAVNCFTLKDGIQGYRLAEYLNSDLVKELYNVMSGESLQVLITEIGSIPIWDLNLLMT